MEDEAAKQEFYTANEHPEIQPSEIKLGSLLGHGSFSKVYKGKCRGQDVAVKIFLTKNDSAELENIRDEIKIMSKIFHPNVVLFMGACTDPGKELMIVTERLPTDLHNMVIEQKDKYKLSLRKRMKLAKETALGVNWLHCSTPQFVHRDLKLSNLLVTHDLHVKVADFGLTRMKDKNAKSTGQPQGSPAYMAPEVFMGEYDEKCDVYSFGMVLWEMLCEEKVFSDFTSLQALMHAVIDEGERPEIPENCPTSLRKLIRACWDPDPRKRPSFNRILEQLDHVITDVAIQDHSARALWKKNFWGKNAVTWSDFGKAVCKSLKVQIPVDFSDASMSIELRCLAELVSTEPKKALKRQMRLPDNAKVVKMKTFGKIVMCFGPFDRTILDRIRDHLAARWFHGQVGQEDAEAMLQREKVGTFLIRFSRAAGFFTLSVAGKRQIEHHRIINVPGHGCYVWKDQFEDLFAVVKAGKRRKLLKKSCPGTPYEHLFPKKGHVKPVMPASSGYMLPSEAELVMMASKDKSRRGQ